MGAVRDNNYFVIHGWMINQLGLKGNELQLYAIIYGFTQADGQKFRGSLQYLADWTGIAKRNVIVRLQSLVEKGLLEKADTYTNGVKGCEYRCLTALKGDDETSPVVMKHRQGGDETSLGRCRNITGGGDETSPNNISDKDIDISIDKDKGVPPTPSPEKKPTKKTAADTEAILARYAQDAKTLELLREWLKVRKAKRAPQTEKALTLNLDKLQDLAKESGLTVEGYLEAVIARGWAAFYPIRETVQRSQTPQATRSRIKTEAEHAAGQHASGFGW